MAPKLQFPVILTALALVAFTVAAQDEDGSALSDPASFFSNALPEPESGSEPDPAPEAGGGSVSEAETIEIRCGRIIAVDAGRTPVLWRRLRDVLVEPVSLTAAGDDVSLTRLSPEPGNQFVILTVALAQGRSLGRFDYVLAADGRRYECRGMSRDLLPFDPRNWEFRHKDGEARIKLLFQVPDDVREASLVSALPLTLPVPEVEIAWAEGVGGN